MKSEEEGTAAALADGDDVIATAVRGELAEQLQLAPDMLDGLGPEAAARALDHLNEVRRRLRALPAGESAAGRGQADERRDVVARALRDELAQKLRLHPRLLSGLRAEAAAATLARVNQNSQRLAQLDSGVAGGEVATEVPTERRDMVARVIRDGLALELGVEAKSLVEMSPELAAVTLSHLSQVHRRLRQLEGESEPEPPAATVPDRRDIVGRTIRDELSEKLNLEAGLLGDLTPRAGAALLLQLQAMNRRLRELEQRIAVDELTGALRRAAGREALEREVDRARRADGRLVLAFIDVDHLKSVNDEEGHAAGDELLQTAAATLRSRLRRYDLVVRWGGDEFVAVLPQTDVEGARRIFEEIEAAYRNRTGGRTFSVGFAALEEGDHAEQLVDRADLELYAKKRERREREEARSGQGPEEANPAPEPAPVEAADGLPKHEPLWKRWTAIGSLL